MNVADNKLFMWYSIRNRCINKWTKEGIKNELIYFRNDYSCYTCNYSKYNFESKIQEALNTEKDRVIIQQVSNINTLLKAESILKVGNPVIICVDTEINLPLDYNNFDYLIEMGKYPQQGIKKIKSLK